jgi:hypothetical protein
MVVRPGSNSRKPGAYRPPRWRPDGDVFIGASADGHWSARPEYVAVRETENRSGIEPPAPLKSDLVVFGFVEFKTERPTDGGEA